MKIAIDVSPLQTGHKVRGVGFYLEYLKKGLLKYFPENNYLFLKKGEKLSNDIDLIHYPYFDPLFLTLPIIKKYKTVVTVHDLTPLVFPQYFPSGLKGKLKWQIQKALLKNVDAIITDSNCSKKDIVKFTGISEKKINVVYLAAGEEFKVIHNSREEYSLPEKFALYVGDVTWNKNLPRLIEAIKNINVPLVMVGKALLLKDFDKNNPWNKDLIKVQNLIKDDKNIIRLGFIPTEDLIAIYNLATVFVMPSLYEGFGLPILEAMSCGCPVVTTKEGSLSEIAGGAAFYVDAYDVVSIKNGIREVFENKKLQHELSLKGLEQSSRFTWEKTATATEKVYNEVLKNN